MPCTSLLACKNSKLGKYKRARVVGVGGASLVASGACLGRRTARPRGGAFSGSDAGCPLDTVNPRPARHRQSGQRAGTRPLMMRSAFSRHLRSKLETRQGSPNYTEPHRTTPPNYTELHRTTPNYTELLHRTTPNSTEPHRTDPPNSTGQLHQTTPPNYTELLHRTTPPNYSTESTELLHRTTRPNSHRTPPRAEGRAHLKTRSCSSLPLVAARKQNVPVSSSTCEHISYWHISYGILVMAY